MKYTRETIYVDALNREAKLYVGLPEGYAHSDKRYPVLYMHDAHNLFAKEDSYKGTTWGIIEAYEQHGDLPEIIVVGMDCAEGVERLNEYGPHVFDIDEFDEYGSEVGGKGEVYLDYLAYTLKPMIDARYRTLSETSNTAIMGSSMGGVISFHAAVKYSDVFSRIGSVSGAYFVSMKAFIESAGKADLSSIRRFYLDVGDEEVGGGGPEDYIICNQMIYELLSKKLPQDRLQYRLIAGGKHQESDWAERLPDILRFLFS